MVTELRVDSLHLFIITSLACLLCPVLLYFSYIHMKPWYDKNIFFLDSEPPLKKIRSYQTPDGYEIEIEGTPKIAEIKSEFPTSADPSNKLSKWNQCTYKCAVCNKSSNSRNTITTHIIDDHGISFRDYKTKYPDLEVSSLVPRISME